MAGSDASSPSRHEPGETSRRISALISDPLPKGVLRANVDDHKITSPAKGFGKLWRKHFWIRLDGTDISPEDLIALWRTHYTKFWPKGSHLYQPLGKLDEGDVAAADLAMIGGVRIGTGVVVTDVQDRSFTLTSLQGHTFCGSITFSGTEDHGATVAEIVAVLRASDPLYEVGMALGGHQYENRFWKATLVALGRYLGVDSPPGMKVVCLDKHRQWRRVANITRNALLHTVAYLAAEQFRRIFRRLRPKERSS